MCGCSLNSIMRLLCIIVFMTDIFSQIHKFWWSLYAEGVLLTMIFAQGGRNAELLYEMPFLGMSAARSAEGSVCFRCLVDECW